MTLLGVFDSNFLLISLFLTPSDLLEIPQISKFFRDLCHKSQNWIQERCLELMNLPKSSDFLLWQKIYFQTKPKDLKPLRKKLYPYYTNGGTYQNLNEYFIDNLIFNKRAYCTVPNNNVLVKYVYVETSTYSYNDPPETFQKGPNEYFLEMLEKESDENKNSLALVKRIHISSPTRGYTAPVKVLICFSSYEKVEDTSLISSFNSCKTPESVIKVAETLKISASIKAKYDRTEIEFGKSQEKIQPLYWASMNLDKIGRCGYNVDLENHYFSRYFYVLLISADNEDSGNIDVASVTPYSLSIRVRKD